MAEVVVSGTPLRRESTQAPTKEYRLKAGKKPHFHTVGEEVLTINPGDTVELTERQAQAFADKFELANPPVETSVDRAAGVVNRQAGNVTSTEGVKTTTPGEKPAPQPESSKTELDPGSKLPASSNPDAPKSVAKTEVKK